ncbi:histone-like nucleoid-structuring protein, MvaT/MvaU family [Halomonas sp. 3D7M]|uniref:histone-like nucleoid-structuring protein, MvaT/MvaU family n=1 Tax=Halomonas sp. 3D7M TaxID=2742617 RepID=UPI00186646A4|nr:histone-like nucleoid-structuring protein, MvaT/MvaU family [Halomonas sp. 3D7M]
MSMILTKYIEKEQQIKNLQDQLDKLKENPSFQLEMKFKERLTDLMSEFGKTKKEVVILLEPQTKTKALPGQGQGKMRKQRKLKIYRNPETGDVIETRGGNHNTLKHWKEKYGVETVDSWLVKEGI